MIVYILIVAALIVFIFSSALFFTGTYLYLRPHWTKIFFSYSHKDRHWAERIIDRLQAYNFRVYIDFGLEIQAEDLERELSKAIRKRDIFVLLASENSAESHWVQFEVNRAEQADDRGFTQWRDMVFLTIDDRGFETAEYLRMRNEEILRAYWNRETNYQENFQKEPPEQREKIKASMAKGRALLALFPFLRRILLKEIKVFDLRRDFDSSILPMEEYLRNNTRFIGGWASTRGGWAPRIVYIYFMTIILLGIMVSGGMFLVFVLRLL